MGESYIVSLAEGEQEEEIERERKFEIAMNCSAADTQALSNPISPRPCRGARRRRQKLL